MDKKEICERLNMVCKTLDILEVKGIKNAGNVAGCYSILQEVLACLSQCEIVRQEKTEAET